MNIKTGDTVVVLSGASKGVKGKVIDVSLKEKKVMVEGAHLVKKHYKPRKQGEAAEIKTLEGAIYACKVALYCDKCDKGVRVKHVIKDGKKIRVCAKCGKEL